MRLSWLVLLPSFLLAGSAAGEPLSGPGLVLARLKYGGGGDWYSNPTSLPNLARALEERTAIPIERYPEARIAPLDEDLFNYPLIYMNGHGRVRLTEGEAARLRQYLLGGGFLFADDNYGMDESFRLAMREVFPDRSLAEVPFDHPVYHSFYDFDNGPPKIHEHDGKLPQGLGIFDRGRLVVFYTYEADIGDGLEDPDVHQDPPEKREEAVRMAVNVVVYALTGEAASDRLDLPAGARGADHDPRPAEPESS
ncbi:MAG: DUF4159 domain-containing protein [Candidatus Eisenbacteria bacterium]